MVTNNQDYETDSVVVNPRFFQVVAALKPSGSVASSTLVHRQHSTDQCFYRDHATCYKYLVIAASNLCCHTLSGGFNMNTFSLIPVRFILLDQSVNVRYLEIQDLVNDVPRGTGNFINTL